MAKLNPFHNDAFATHAEQIEALKNELSEALSQIRDLREAYGNLHDGLTDMIGDDGDSHDEENRLTPDMIPDDYEWLVETLCVCSGVAHGAKQFLTQTFPDRAVEEDEADDRDIVATGEYRNW